MRNRRIDENIAGHVRVSQDMRGYRRICEAISDYVRIFQNYEEIAGFTRILQNKMK